MGREVGGSGRSQGREKNMTKTYCIEIKKIKLRKETVFPCVSILISPSEDSKSKGKI